MARSQQRVPLYERVPLPVQSAMMRSAFALPQRLRRRIAGPPVRLDDQELALDAQLLIKLLATSEVSLSGTGDPAASRALLEDAASFTGGPPIQPVLTRELRIATAAGGLDARLYSPAGVREPAGLLILYHGGGWVLGSIDTHDNAARLLAKHAGVRVLSVAYRLAPEHPFPAAVDDALAAFDDAYARAGELGIDPQRIAVGGDSAGGNLAAVVAHQTTRRGGPTPAFQLLIYPAVDFATHYPSRAHFADGFFLTQADSDWFERHYLPEPGQVTDERMSVLRAADLSGQPPAYIATAGFDILRDEGEAYARALAEAGVSVALRRESDLIHGFVNFVGLGRRFREATIELAGALRTGLALSSKGMIP